MNKTRTLMRVRRIQIGITQTELARQIGVTQPRISLWENRLAEMPPKRAGQISELLQIDRTELLHDA